jgi:hypothetical protein
MAAQSSFSQVADQIVNYNTNTINILTGIDQAMKTTDSSVTVKVTDSTGLTSSLVSIPSFNSLQSQIKSLENSVKAIYSIDYGSALLQTVGSSGFKKVVTVNLNREPSDVSGLVSPVNFVTNKNWIFDGLMNPTLSIELDLSGKIDDTVRKILVRRYIPEFSSDSSGNATPLGVQAINSFDSLFKNQSEFTLNEYENWHRNTPGLVEPFTPNYDEQMFDLEPNRLEYDGAFTPVSTQEDTINRKSWVVLDKLTYVRNVLLSDGVTYTQQERQLAVGDELVVNIAGSSTTKYRIDEISTSQSLPRVRLTISDGFEPIPVSVVGGLKIYSPVLYSKKVRVSIGYNERNAVFVKAIDMNNYIMSKNWSKGIGYYTNDLTNRDNNISMSDYYSSQVYDYGMVLKDLVAKKTPNTLAGTPNVVTLNPTNFKVVRINQHLNSNNDTQSIKQLYSQVQTLKSEVSQINDSIVEKNKLIRATRFTSESARKQSVNELDSLNNQRVSKSNLLSSINTQIINTSNLTVTPRSTGVTPEFRLRGFWSIPEPVQTRGTKPQEIIQFRVQYRYTSKDGRESPVETFKLSDAPTDAPSTQKNGAFSNWNEFKSDVRKRVFNAADGTYTWAIEDVSDADTPNINQIDIPIRPNERVEIRIKSISEVGYPESPVESEWSEILSVEFPDSLNNVLNETDFILKEASKEDLRVSIQSDLSAKGLDDHLSEQVVVNNVTYLHGTDRILSGFKDQNGLVLSLLDYLSRLENRVQTLEEKISRIKGELQVVIYRNNVATVIKNGSETTYVVECEDYIKEKYNAPGVPSGRVYPNNIYVIKEFSVVISNKSLESDLGLLSNRTYDPVSNAVAYNSATPQVFWVDQSDQLQVSNTTGVSRTQVDYQYLWSINYDNVNQTTIDKLSENVANNFVADNNNSLTTVLSSNSYNLGYNENSILSFVGNDLSLTDKRKWIDVSQSAVSVNKLLTTVHPMVQDLSRIQETNSDKVKTVKGGQDNNIVIPIRIYFKLNALDSNRTGSDYQYVNLNSPKPPSTHIKKIKFLLENEADNRPFAFSVIFRINRQKTVVSSRDRLGLNDLSVQVNVSGADMAQAQPNNLSANL